MRTADVKSLLGGARDALYRDRDLIARTRELQGAVALEPGGPSSLFGRYGAIPVYPRLGALDTLDYRERTLWSADSKPPEALRRMLIGEARHMGDIPADSYDAVLASHVLEHIADPLGALAEWQRVVRPGGHILLVVPHREGTFDRRREVTTVEHLRSDAERETGEEDLTHLEEILELHDMDRDPGAESRELFEGRCRENASTRAMHHHVFDSRSVVEMCKAAGLGVLAIRPRRPFHIVCLCRVGDGDTSHGDTPQLGENELANALARSPFKSDRDAA